MANDGSNEVSSSIAGFLASRQVPPTSEWMQGFMQTIRPSTPLAALQKTALFRILATDITTSIKSSPASTLPTGISDTTVQEQRLPGTITVQLLDVEDIGRSRWSQVEAMEAYERGETTKGREIIRVVADEGENGATQAISGSTRVPSMSFGPHKLLLQDATGAKVYGLELKPIAGVGVSMAIGSKLVLRGCVVARGVLLLEPAHVEMLGGKVEAWDKKWRDERKAVLKEKAEISNGGAA